MKEVKKFLKHFRQDSMLGHKTRQRAYMTLFCVAILSFIGLNMFVFQPMFSTVAMLATIPLIAIVKDGRPKEEKDLSQEERDTLATIQKTINDALTAFVEKNQGADAETVEKFIDAIVGDAQDELKSKDKNGNFATAIKEVNKWAEVIKSMATELENLKKGDGIEFGKKSGVEKIADDIVNSDKFKLFASGESKKSGKIRIEKTVSLAADYDGDKLITRRSGYLQEHPQPRKINVRDIMTVDQGDAGFPTITFTQITNLDRNAAVVSENGRLPESAYAAKEVTESVRRIGTYVPVSKRMLKSLKWLKSWLSNRLPTWVKMAEDFQMLKGDGQGDNLLGIMKQCPDFKTVLSDSLITGAAGSIKSVASYNGGTQTVIEFTDPQPLVNNGANIAFAALASSYNTTFVVNKISDSKIMIDKAYTAVSDPSLATFKSGGEFADSVEDPNKIDVIRAARAYLTYGEYSPNAIALNPIDVFAMSSYKDTTGRYLNEVVSIDGVVRVNGLMVVETTAIAAGEFVIGDFRNGASLADFTALELEFAEDVETKLTNQVVVIIQEEVIMPVYNPFAFLRGKFDEIIPMLEK